MTNTTSRDYILDAVEMMQNLIALCSHAQEIINVSNVDYSTEEDEETKADLFDSMERRADVLGDALEQRREVQKQLFDEGEGDHKAWCAFKHAVANHGYAVEVWYANLGTEAGDFWYIQMQKAYELMIKVASVFLGVDEITTCGRCLVDKLRADGTEGEESNEGSS